MRAILPDFKIDIEYSDGNIPDLFREKKELAYCAVKQIEDTHKILREFLISTDPIEATLIAERFDRDFAKTLTMPEIFDSNLYYKSKRFLEQVEFLKNDELLKPFLKLKRDIKNNVNEFLVSNLSSVGLNSVHMIEIRYNASTFETLIVENCILNFDSSVIKNYCEFINCNEGNINLQINVGLNLRNQDPILLNECCLLSIIEKIYGLKYFAA